MTKDVADAIRERRSIRRFTSDEIPDAALSRLLEAACLAPSAGNRQPWFFYVVKTLIPGRNLPKQPSVRSSWLRHRW